MNIFVGGLLEDVKEEHLEKTFGVYGKVNSVTVVKDSRSGAPRGFGYVEMPVNAEATAAIAGLNGYSRLGGALEVHEILRPAPRILHARPRSRTLPTDTRSQKVKAPALKN